MTSTDTTPDAAEPRLYRLHIFSDFDGTISPVDIGHALFDRFGAQEPWNSMLERGEIGIEEYWEAMVRELRVPLSDAAIDDFLRDLPVDPGFADLLALARSEEIPFTVVSDGLDLYIARYLAMHDAADVPYFSNAGRIDAEGGLTLRFPWKAEGCCRRFTIACKRNVVLGCAHPDARIVYIGDGISDTCAAEHADIIFAKGRLAAHCNLHRLPHYPFTTLHDVERRLRALLDRRRIRPRHQAMLLRKSAWESE